MRIIVPSITTHSKSENNWKSKLIEVEKLGISQIGLFVTGLNPEERQICFRELVKLRNRFDFSIPFVHAVASMKEVEFRFLRDCFRTQKFNLHPLKEYPLEFNLSDSIRENILIENASCCAAITEKDVEGFGGICIDIAHLDDMQRNHPDQYEFTIELLSKVPVGANHISAVSKISEYRFNCCHNNSIHVATSFEEFDYLGRHPESVYSNMIAIELENSINDQLQFLSFIRKSVQAFAMNSEELAVA